MKKVKRYRNAGMVEQDNYPDNENREGRESTLDPSDREDAERGRRMTGTFGKVEYSPNFETSPVRSEYDAQSGLDYAPGMGSRKPVAAAKPRPKPPVKPAKPFAATPVPTREDVPTATLPSKPPAATKPAETKPAETKKGSSFLTPRGQDLYDRFKKRLTSGYEFGKKAGGSINYKKGGSVSSASKRADGIAIRGKTRGKMV